MDTAVCTRPPPLGGDRQRQTVVGFETPLNRHVDADAPLVERPRHEAAEIGVVEALVLGEVARVPGYAMAVEVVGGGDDQAPVPGYAASHEP